jgi:hypothetical protein
MFKDSFTIVDDPRTAAFQIAAALTKRTFGPAENISEAKAQRHAAMAASLYRLLTSVGKKDESTPDMRRRADAEAYYEAYELFVAVHGSTSRISEDQAITSAAFIRKMHRILTLQDDEPIDPAKRRSKRAAVA